MFMHNADAFLDARPIAVFTPAPAGAAAAGIAGGTLIGTPAGWRAARTLRPGMLVHTLDGGVRPLADVLHRPAGADEAAIRVPGGALSNCGDLWLMPRQDVVIESPVLRAVLGVPQALVAAEELEGLLGCRRVRGWPEGVVTLRCAGDEIVFANSGALLRCEGAGTGRQAGFERLSGGRVRALAELIEAGALSLADLRCAA